MGTLVQTQLAALSYTINQIRLVLTISMYMPTMSIVFHTSCNR